MECRSYGPTHGFVWLTTVKSINWGTGTSGSSSCPISQEVSMTDESDLRRDGGCSPDGNVVHDFPEHGRRDDWVTLTRQQGIDTFVRHLPF